MLDPSHPGAPGVKPDTEPGPKPVRVALDVTPTVGSTTGVGNHVVGLRRALQSRPDQVEVVPLVMSWAGRQQGGATHRPLPAKVRELWMRTDHPRVERFVGPVDVVHGTNFVVPPARAAQLVTIHDLTVVRFPELVLKDNRAFVPLIQRAVARGAWVHAVSQAVAEEVRTWLPEASDRVVTIYAGIPELAEAHADGLDPVLADRLTTRSASSAPMVLSLGTEEPRKGIPTLVDAVARLMSVDDDLIWVHAGPRGWASEQIDTKLSTLDASVRARIFRLGFVSAELRTYLLQRASVFVYPSVYEGFGMPPLEAMTLGVPVVASDVDAHREVIGQAGLLVPVNDADAFASAVHRVLHDDAFSDELSEQGTRNVGRFTWDRMADQMIGLYAKLADRS